MNNLTAVFARLLLRHYRTYAAIAATCFFASFALLYLAPTPLWQASGLVRIGQAPYSNDEKMIELGPLMPVESSMALIRQDADRVVRDSIKLQKKWHFRVRPAAEGILELKVEAFTPEIAAKIHQALVAELKAMHEQQFQERSSFWKSQYALVSSNLEVGQQIWKSQTEVCNQLAAKLDEGGLLCANLLLHENIRQNELARLQRTIQEALLPVWSYPTEAFGSINISKEPVSPNMLIALILSLFISLCLSLTLLMISCVWSALRSSAGQDS